MDKLGKDVALVLGVYLVLEIVKLIFGTVTALTVSIGGMIATLIYLWYVGKDAA
jgi:hypothetical protein